MLPEIKQTKFNEQLLNDTEKIDFIVSKFNRKLSEHKLFSVWTYSTNHIHELQPGSDCYFVVWVGEIGKGKCKSLVFGRINTIEKYLKEIKIQEVIDYIE